MQGKKYIGIDPGSKGFISYDHFGFLPLADTDELGISVFLEECLSDCDGNAHVCVEDVHSMFGDTPKTAFALGRSLGLIIGILTALRIPYSTVSPKRWQSEIFCPADKQMKPSKDGTHQVLDTKETSIHACRRLFPCVDLRRTERCKVFDHNKSDAVLIEEYARRKQL